MKRFTRITLWLSLIFVLIGIAIAGTGVVLGGTRISSVFQEKVGVASFLSLPFYAMNDKMIKEHTEDDTVRETGELGKAEEIKKINLDMEAASFRLVPYEGDTFKYESNKTGYFIWEQDKDSLQMESKHNYWKSIFRRDIRSVPQFILYVPQKAELEEVEIYCGMGEGDIANIYTKDLYAQVGMGNMKIDGSSAANSKLYVDAGELIMTGATLNNTEISVVVGNVQFEGSVNGDLRADCDMGSISMYLEQEKEDFQYDIQCDMGTVRIDKEDYSSSLRARLKDENGGRQKMEIVCGMGNVDVMFNKNGG
ncbi:MAG: DUF4097 domain-containing protein [Lachnospiraceae bacterium]|jgi:hypothetical protein|nr:DUF4097 domain-containing protein [Lachnospiraceae bacterium]